MSQHAGVNRRAFLKNAGLTALVGAVGPGTSFAAAAPLLAAAAENGKYDFDTPYSRVGTDSVKYDQQIRAFSDNQIIGMGIADMDFRAAPCIGKALQERMKHENWGYLDMPKNYTETIAAWNKKRYGLNVNPESIVLTTGVHPGLIAAIKTFSPVGTRVLLLTPTYNGFYGDLRFCQVEAAESPMKLVDGKYSIDFDDFERRISHDTNTLILCNPQNPTGNTWSPEDLTRIGEICLKRRVIVLADEIHCDFVNKGQKYTPFATLPNKAIVNNSITFKAASKSFSLAAMKAAWFFSDNQDLITRVKANNRADLTSLGMIANRAVLTEGEDWLDQVSTYIDGNHTFAEKFIKERIPLIKWVKPQGTYLAWIDISQVADKIGAKQQAMDQSNSSGKQVTPEQIVERYFVKTAHVHMNAGSSYGLGGANHMRMNIATSRKTLEQALTNLANALNNIRPGSTAAVAND